MAWETLSIPDVSTDIESQYFETDDAIEWSYVDITSLNSLLVFNSEVTIYTKDNFRLAIYTTSTPGATYEPYRPEYRIYYNNTLVASALCYDCDTVGLAIGYNTETQKAKLRSVQKRWAVYPPSPSDALYSSYRVTWDSSTQSDVYNALLNANLISEPITANGGGTTHIAKVTGQLKDLSSNLSDILMVSGGGGGGLIVGETAYSGKEAGGISGSGDNSADQSTGNAFGQGESGTNKSGGGSGLYGGYKGTSAKSGGAGSGYIGNSLLSNKKMVGYNVPTSSAEATKTESINVFDSNPVANKPKAGNGFARIKFLREPTWDVVGTWIDGSTIYKERFDFHNANGFGQEDEFTLDLPECKHLFLGDSWMNVNPPNEDVRVFPFPYITTTMNIIVGFLFGKDSTTNKPMFRLRRGSSTNVYDLYITIHFILK